MSNEEVFDLRARLRTLEAENRALRASKEDLECFVYAMSHDLAAPLRAITAFSHLLAEHGLSSESARTAHYLSGIRTGVERMHELHKCWLDMIRCDRGPMQRGCVDLSGAARSICEELQAAEPERRIDIRVASGLSAYADPVLARELLQNLLANAWKFTRGALAAPTIECGAVARDGETIYFVRDNGVGFDMREAGRLFQPFQRLCSATRFDGAGVGLAIARRICERHEGRIWAEAEPGRGATFWFTLHRSSQHRIPQDATPNTYRISACRSAS